jgi:glycosyltransferase involved in cell wall biosynthesis
MESEGGGRMKLSIIIPHCNEYQNLFMTVQNIFIQMQHDPRLKNSVEIIVVDNLSDDIVAQRAGDRPHRHDLVKLPHYTNVVKFLPKQWFAQTGALRVIEYKDDQSLWKSRQAGLDAARGDYILFSDAHVLHEPGTFALAIEDLERFPEIGELHGGQIYFFSPNDAALYQYELELETRFWGKWTAAAPNYVDAVTPFKIPMSSQASAFYRKSDLDEWGRAPGRIGIYGGDETFMSMRTWMMGKQVWSDPRIRYHHLADERGYVFNNRDFTKNTFLVAYLLGGEEWLDKIYRNFHNDYLPHYYAELDWARDISMSCGAERDQIMRKVRYSLNDVVAARPWSIPPTSLPASADIAAGG